MRRFLGHCFAVSGLILLGAVGLSSCSAAVEQEALEEDIGEVESAILKCIAPVSSKAGGPKGGWKPCAAGLSCCQGTSCVDLQTDEENCGKCGSVCRTLGTLCFDGACLCPPQASTKCKVPGTQTVKCTDTSSDVQNCGACGVDCSDANPWDPICCNGTCMGKSDFLTNELNCGSCGHVCPPDTQCISGRCRCDYPGSPGGCACGTELLCTEPGFECCGDTPMICTRIDTKQHCGSCDLQCPLECVPLGLSDALGCACLEPVDCNGTAPFPGANMVCCPLPNLGVKACTEVNFNPLACGPDCLPCTGNTPNCYQGICQP